MVGGVISAGAGEKVRRKAPGSDFGQENRAYNRCRRHVSPPSWGCWSDRRFRVLPCFRTENKMTMGPENAAVAPASRGPNLARPARTFRTRSRHEQRTYGTGPAPDGPAPGPPVAPLPGWPAER